MTSLEIIENLLDIEIGERKLRNGRKYPDKNQYYRYDNYYIMKLSGNRNLWCIVDNTREMRKLMRLHNWYPTTNNTHPSAYVRTSVKGKVQRLHRILMNNPDGLVVDHINRKSFDNRRENLRMVTQKQNLRNQSIRKTNTTGHTGVSRSGNGKYTYFCARIFNNDGIQISKSFSIKKFGEEEAKEMAVQQRKAWEQEYQYQGE